MEESSLWRANNTARTVVLHIVYYAVYSDGRACELFEDLYYTIGRWPGYIVYMVYHCLAYCVREFFSSRLAKLASTGGRHVSMELVS